MSDGLATQLQQWDGHSVVIRYDEPTESWIFIALHDDTLGRPTGGTRMKTYATPAAALADAQLLAAGMTRKWAAIDMGMGGGKAVLAVPRPLAGDDRRGLLLRYGRLIESLGGRFATGADLGTTPEDLLVIAEETQYVHGVDRQAGTVTNSGPYTARGVFAAIQAAVDHRFGSPRLTERSVLVEGVGSVGESLARSLADAGAKVAVSDVAVDRARQVAAACGGLAVETETVAETTCDVYAPCAVGGVLSEATIPRLGCSIVAGAANNQLACETEDARRLQERQILYCPDFINNAGAAIGLTLEGQGADPATIDQRIVGIGQTTRDLLAQASSRNESPLFAARRKVEAVLGRTD